MSLNRQSFINLRFKLMSDTYNFFCLSRCGIGMDHLIMGMEGGRGDATEFYIKKQCIPMAVGCPLTRGSTTPPRGKAVLCSLLLTGPKATCIAVIGVVRPRSSACVSRCLVLKGAMLTGIPAAHGHAGAAIQQRLGA